MTPWKGLKDNMKKLILGLSVFVTALLVGMTSAQAATTVNVTHGSSGTWHTVLVNHTCASVGSTSSLHMFVCVDLEYQEYYWHSIGFSSSQTDEYMRLQVGCANGTTIFQCSGAHVYGEMYGGGGWQSSFVFNCGKYGGSACSTGRNYTAWHGVGSAIYVSSGDGTRCDLWYGEEWDSNAYITSTYHVAGATYDSPQYRLCDSVG